MAGDIVYGFNIIGGDFDGAPGMSWLDDGKHEPPTVIYVGVCDAEMDCGSSACEEGKRHVSFWTPDEADRPMRAQAYERENLYVEAVADEHGALRGRADYAIGGLRQPKNFGEAAKRMPANAPPEYTPAEPLVPAGLVGGRHDTGFEKPWWYGT